MGRSIYLRRIALMIVIALGLGWILLTLDRTPEEARSVDPGAPQQRQAVRPPPPMEPDPESAVRTTVAGSAEEALSATTGPSAVGGTTLQGRVTDAEGVALAGAEVRVMDARYHAIRRVVRPGDQLASTRSRRGGGFSVHLEPGGHSSDELRYIYLEASNAGRVTASKLVSFGEQPATYDVGDIALDRGYTLDGMVVDPAGRGVPGVEILGATPFGDPPVSDGSGWFALEGIPSGSRRLWLRSNEYVSPHGEDGVEVVVPEGGPPEPLRLLVLPTRTVEVLVTDAQTGTLIPNAWVVVSWHSPHGKGWISTAEYGQDPPRALTARVPQGAEWSAIAAQPWYHDSARRPAGPGADSLRLELTRAPCIEVLVTDAATGEPMRPDRIRVLAWSDWLYGKTSGPFLPEQAMHVETYETRDQPAHRSLESTEVRLGCYRVRYDAAYPADVDGAPPHGMLVEKVGYTPAIVGPEFIAGRPRDVGPWNARLERE